MVNIYFGFSKKCFIIFHFLYVWTDTFDNIIGCIILISNWLINNKTYKYVYKLILELHFIFLCKIILNRIDSKNIFILIYKLSINFNRNQFKTNLWRGCLVSIAGNILCDVITLLMSVAFVFQIRFECSLFLESNHIT